MARYVIGDIQGCYTPLMKLLAEIGFNPSKDVLYFVGDLVNRGKESLQVLRWAYANQDNLVTVLGNHDIYLLARYSNIRKADKDETIQDILSYPDAHKLIDWLRGYSLIYQDTNYIVVHAGIYPRMDFNCLIQLNHQISNHLKSKAYPEFIDKIYGNKPNSWQSDLSLQKQMKFAVNACTRMRYLNSQDFSLDYDNKGEFKDKIDGLTPWFKVDSHPSINKKIIFGHWAALGLYQDNKCMGIDTGCVWGKKLTAVNLETLEIIQVENKR